MDEAGRFSNPFDYGPGQNYVALGYPEFDYYNLFERPSPLNSKSVAEVLSNNVVEPISVFFCVA